MLSTAAEQRIDVADTLQLERWLDDISDGMVPVELCE